MTHKEARKLARELYDDMRSRGGFDIEVDKETEAEWLKTWTFMIERATKSKAVTP